MDPHSTIEASYKPSPLLSCERRCARAVRALRCTYCVHARKTEHDLPAAVADFPAKTLRPSNRAGYPVRLKLPRLMQVRFLVLCIRSPARREQARAVRDGPRLLEFLSDTGLLSQEAAVVRTRRFALQKCKPVAQVIKDLEEEIPVQILGRAPSQRSCRIDGRVALRAGGLHIGMRNFWWISDAAMASMPSQ